MPMNGTSSGGSGVGTVTYRRPHSSHLGSNFANNDHYQPATSSSPYLSGLYDNVRLTGYDQIHPPPGYQPQHHHPQQQQQHPSYQHQQSLNSTYSSSSNATSTTSTSTSTTSTTTGTSTTSGTTTSLTSAAGSGTTSGPSSSWPYFSTPRTPSPTPCGPAGPPAASSGPIAGAGMRTATGIRVAAGCGTPNFPPHLLNTKFKSLTLPKMELDRANKDKAHRLFLEQFQVKLYFSPMDGELPKGVKALPVQIPPACSAPGHGQPGSDHTDHHGLDEEESDLSDTDDEWDPQMSAV